MTAKYTVTPCSVLQDILQNVARNPQKTAIFPSNWKKGEEVLRPAA